mgnify:CR=1 FL=1
MFIKGKTGNENESVSGRQYQRQRIQKRMDERMIMMVSCLAFPLLEYCSWCDSGAGKKRFGRNADYANSRKKYGVFPEMQGSRTKSGNHYAQAGNGYFYKFYSGVIYGT